MLDTSYAAAWQLGQLLTLQNTDVATALFEWKRRRARAAAQAEEPAYLPFSDAVETLPLPDSVVQWFRDLALFKNVPFNYFAPTETMLPKESLRLFQIDPFWRECLIDGAFSVGRVTATDASLDKAERAEVWDCLEDVLSQSGVLLRSHVVEGWPHLQVVGYRRTPPKNFDHDGPFALPLENLRKERLGNDILLCLFDKKVATIDFHEVPETIHFGVGYAGEEQTGDDPRPEWYKAYRSVRTAVEQTEKGYVDIESHWTASTRTINMSSLSSALAQLGGEDGDSPDHSWWFGFEMIEGVERVRVISQDQ